MTKADKKVLLRKATIAFGAVFRELSGKKPDLDFAAWQAGHAIDWLDMARRTTVKAKKSPAKRK